MNGPPIVLIFRRNHYNWLRFSTEEKSCPKEEGPEQSREAESNMHFAEDFPTEDTEISAPPPTDKDPNGNPDNETLQPENAQRLRKLPTSTGGKPKSQAEQEDKEESENMEAVVKKN
ncbi:hypothetical protein PR003_g4778 [Phytophthora rubi]|uniref:Uncharacterized protein n=1 Tax=Phytophthora rubi TaxID=129364 RepID=A0A6A3NYC9_9STRA|nr:hypothetical protein PR002_g4464 [Phytophthora rubi]KAE9046308.1 hypothetical protein PR001_g4626 [Phytophthora rubi]KAE9351688.1 hypothetical protein PR003_g4778 [Phytophthora rubi]